MSIRAVHYTNSGRSYRCASVMVWLVVALLIVACASPSWACDPGKQCFTADFIPGTCAADGTTCNENHDPDGTCTSDPQYTPTPVAPGTGVISSIIAVISAGLAPIPGTMFNAMLGDPGLTGALNAAMVLYVITYAVSFTFGVVQLTVFDLMIRMTKISVVAVLLNGAGWLYMQKTFIRFFGLGIDPLSGTPNGALDLINKVSTIAIGGNNIGGAPFDWMDNAILQITSVKMMVMLMAAAMTGPYGWIIVILLFVAFYTILKGMLNALWIFMMAMVMQALLFGLAPLFLGCVMFSRTRQLFDGWLNQVINTALQPIFIFTFFAFFIVLVKACVNQLMNLTVCWTEYAETLRGSPFSTHYWRFAIWDCNLNIWVPFDGIWDLTGPDQTGCPVTNEHPVGIMLPLILWVLCDLAKRFNDIVLQIAKDIAGASTVFAYAGGAFGGGKGDGGGNPQGDKNPKAPAGRKPIAERLPGEAARLRDKIAGMQVGNRKDIQGQDVKLP